MLGVRVLPARHHEEGSRRWSRRNAEGGLRNRSLRNLALRTNAPRPSRPCHLPTCDIESCHLGYESSDHLRASRRLPPLFGIGPGDNHVHCSNWRHYCRLASYRGHGPQGETARLSWPITSPQQSSDMPPRCLAPQQRFAASHAGSSSASPVTIEDSMRRKLMGSAVRPLGSCFDVRKK